MKIYDDRLIVVTGGAGFIGSCVVRYLNELGRKNIVIVDELGKTEKWKNLVGKQVVDIIDKNVFFNWLVGRESLIGSFIHLGACSDTQETDASYLLENNYRYSVRLAEYALKNNIRFIYASSAATYGDGSLGFLDDPKGIDKLQPLNMYGYSKQLFDMWVKNQGLLDHFVGLKYFNVFGPNEYHKGRMASALIKMVPAVLEGKNIQLFRSTEPSRFKDGDQVRDFIYIKDVVKMTCAFLNNDAMGIYNIGTGVPSTWNDLAKAVFAALDQKPRIEYIDMPLSMVSHYQSYTCADMTKTRRVLRKKSITMPLEDSVLDYVKNYLVPGKRW